MTKNQNPSNIGELFRGEVTNRLLCRLGCEEKYYTSEASDFDWFSEWERIYPRSLGTGIAALYREALRMLSMDEPRENLTGEESCARWRQANLALAELHERLETEEMPEEAATTIDLGAFLSQWLSQVRPKEALKISSLTEEILFAIGKEEGEVRLVWNVGGAPFVRPDPYHADLALNAISANEDSERDRFLVLSQTVIELLLKRTDDARVSLHLYSERSYKTIEAFLKYVHGRKISLGSAYLGVFLKDEPQEWIELCDKYGVRPEWILRAEDFGAGFERRLAAILCSYPAGGISFGMSLEEEPFSFLMKELLYRTAELLLALCDSDLPSDCALTGWK